MHRDLGTGGAVVLDTRLVAPARRFDLWAEASAEGPAPIAIAAERRGTFSGLARFFVAPSLSLADIDASSHDVLRGRVDIGRGARDEVHVVLINRGTVAVEQNGRTLLGGAGDMFLVFQDVPFSALHRQACDLQCVNLPAHDFPLAIRDDTPLLLTSRLSPLAPLAAGYIRSLPRDVGALAASAEFISGQLVALIVRALIHESPSTTSPPPLFEAVRVAIEAEIGNPDLSAKLLCARLGVSRSVLFEAVAAQGRTLGSMVLDRRLVGCMEDLRRSDRSDTITAICQRWGFRDSSSFSRAFRRKKGRTPTAWRLGGD